jgi:hypothetical protein
MIQSRKLLILIGFITIFAISACGSDNNITPTKALRGAIVPTRIPTDIPTATSTTTPTNTPTATSTASPTNTATLTYTPTSTASPTPTNTATLTYTPTQDTQIQPPTAEPPPPADDVVPQINPQSIAYGNQEDGTITIDVYEYLYEFIASADDRVDIKMNARDGTLDPLLFLMDEEGVIIAENDDDLNNTGRDSFLQGFTIPEDGTYTIIATRFQQELGSTEGSFTVSLSLTQADSDPPPSPDNDNILRFGEQASGEIINDTYAITYEFMAHQGDVINIQMATVNDNDSLDPLLILANSNGDTLAENDDDPESTGRNSFIHEFEIPADGAYTIIATRFQQDLGSTTGIFDVLLDLSKPPSNSTKLQYGDSYSGQITPEIDSEQHLFDAEAGDIVNISMQTTSGSLDTLLILLDESDNELIRNDDDEQGSGSDSFIRQFEIPANGTYTIIATHFQEEHGTTTGRFTLTIEKVVSET